MNHRTLFDKRSPANASGDDSPVSGGVRAVLERGYAMRLNSGRLDGKLLAATPQELEEISEALSLPLSVLQNRSAVLEATLARQFAE
ncbi:hypothetical protein K3555_08940 [Leisingera sp. M527]|uniref:hypothetical protein n=1 Tax=Leisingera sp. M527 TaxID=2867014 RepID=UPI0021A3D726|nr:hypothetical protein [Leisingera sp. M527]UWQ34591.1 hypothetical protein K3555_08940 [Leisingera sp. M527]